jgi:hypothetical protein
MSEKQQYRGDEKYDSGNLVGQDPLLRSAEEVEVTEEGVRKKA